MAATGEYHRRPRADLTEVFTVSRVAVYRTLRRSRQQARPR